MPRFAHAALAVALASPGVSACRRALSSASPPAESAAPARYRPPLASSVPRILSALARAQPNAPVPLRPLSTRRLDLPVPDDTDVLAVQLTPTRWIVAAIEPVEVTLGLLGAERIHSRFLSRAQSPSAADLARIVGAFRYYPFPVYDGSRWTDPPLALALPPLAPRPQLVAHPGNVGRSLLFTYIVPDGIPDAGPHRANIHVTDSGFLVDESGSSLAP